MNWDDNLEKLQEIAINAGHAILKIYESDDFGVEVKGDDSPLTKADQAANTIICDGLVTLFPEIPIISEENKEVPYEVRKDYDYFWLVDPLDGTKEFIKRNGEFTVNIALIKKDKVVGGIVYTPVTDDLYYAFSNKGAFHKKGTEILELKANAFKMDDPNLGVVCSRSHLNEGTQKFIDQLNQPNLVSKGSSLKFLILASGGAELYPRIAPTMEWDTAAAQIILEEAGGSVVNEETGKGLTYNKEVLRNPYFVAYARLEK
ncbi:3'(2'),5'-bisphosphate nucleotidase CysQ [Portibacter lacus]|uniref:3'(2'),5'-bisphosphate nucleotidase CysQ n=1 Tax=Portibacter lacus TaxID=1099794 RepID=A0AA37SS56_9BACT|nr:3'(2'),5'-bisphosphate nucleotidase CysQ [Portibacter lacus]GLR19247.1 3'(2'),5'-bisphosphate nucleotidase CysQ [Portibacter lacus]